ncbi:YbaY family lipoprotein [Photobacterium sp. CCB-ST2H9]|uniref:YbaY family lipoprotein n=1 Tax=unclassified Photobacterium TaxID=2628852 RepID=UPI0020049146|nr:YbaY family lipoprotein [Photobacterium sp. CCB-ST2H9]UTM58161.1 YbaY family lipoprotein [Photobacterium sp. CCB-ST2H9]
MKKMFALLTLLITAMVISACTNLITKDAGVSKIEGSLAYRERIALPDDALITVTLSDVSLMDAPAEVISSQSYLAGGKQVPFSFTLQYMEGEVKPAHTYAVSARIELNGKLLFITDTANHVITDPAKTTKLDLMLVKVSQ